jgi:hypothetical protein
MVCENLVVLADKGYDKKNDMLWSVYHTVYFNRGNNWFVPKCLVIVG